MFPIVKASRFDLFDDAASIVGWCKVARENNGMLPRSMLARFGSQITDDSLRSTFIGGLSDVPSALYEEKTPAHPEWPPVKPGLYVQWTDAYTMDAARANGAGFDVLVDLASHFRMLNQPEEVARTLIDFGKTLE